MPDRRWSGGGLPAVFTEPYGCLLELEMELVVVKRCVPVRARTADGAIHEGEVFLANYSDHHVGPERVVDLFNGDTEFVPLRQDAEKRTVILNRDRIVEVIVQDPEEALPYTTASEPTAREVKIHLLDGQVLEGTVFYIMPPEYRRLSDYLNRVERFFPVVVGKATHLVRTAQVAWVE